VIWGVFTGSRIRIFLFRIQGQKDPGFGTALKNFSNQKIGKNMIWDVNTGSGSANTGTGLSIPVVRIRFKIECVRKTCGNFFPEPNFGILTVKEYFTGLTGPLIIPLVK
jgi:hypothetical protein